MRPLFKLLFLFVFCCVFGAASVDAAWVPQAQPPAATAVDPGGCDPEFMGVMESRAWLEGQREVEIAERLILKPDSVLEYSCFDTRINEMASNSVFQDSVSTALGNIVGTPAATYINTNFGHGFAGGTYSGAAPPACGAMNAVWSFLKCQDFDIGMFLTFQELAASGGDPRDVPVPCPNAGARSTLWNNMITAANPPPATPAAVGGMDDTVTFNPMVMGGACSGGAIETGVIVQRPGGDISDAVCATPGCYYNGSGCTP